MLIYKQGPNFPHLIKQTGILTVVGVLGITNDLHPDQNNCLGFHLLGWGWRNAQHESISTVNVQELQSHAVAKNRLQDRYSTFLCVLFRLDNLPKTETVIKIINAGFFLSSSMKHQSFPGTLSVNICSMSGCLHLYHSLCQSSSTSHRHHRSCQWMVDNLSVFTLETPTMCWRHSRSPELRPHDHHTRTTHNVAPPAQPHGTILTQVQ